MHVFGLIGNPVGHSLSPPMHEAGFDAIGLDARYVTFEPEPSTLSTAIRGADALGVRGLNVTIPFKRDVLELVEPDDLAARIGAVNTIDFARTDNAGCDDARSDDAGDGDAGTDDARSADARTDDTEDDNTGSDHGLDGTPTGHNTDAAGAVRALREHGGNGSLDGATALVVGAGGAGRAIAFGLADAGATVRIANRTAPRAAELANEVPGASGHELDDVTELLDDADVLVNATSVGMEADDTPVPACAIHGGLTVMDAVYRPLETRLLRDAAERGADTVDGGWMLLYQGVAAFELWTGESAPVEAMNRALRSRL